MGVMKQKKFVVLLASLALVLSVMLTVTGVLAYLHTGGYEVKNTFVNTGVPNHVVESIEDKAKKDVKIQNDGDIDAFVRAMVIVNWVNDKGEIYYIAPEENTDYTLTWTPDTDTMAEGVQTNWVKGSDGYYYHKTSIAPGGMTDILLTECKEKERSNKPEGYYLSVEIVAQTIQVEGTDSSGTAPVLLAWGIEKGGSVVNASDNTLTIQESTKGGTD